MIECRYSTNSPISGCFIDQPLAYARGTVPTAQGEIEMAKRIENECAFCAEEIIDGEEVVGKDWKVYCSERCAEAGEKMSLEEWRKAMHSDRTDSQDAKRAKIDTDPHFSLGLS
jgi:hypothetical protein